MILRNPLWGCVFFFLARRRICVLIMQSLFDGIETPERCFECEKNHRRIAVNFGMEQISKRSHPTFFIHHSINTTIQRAVSCTNLVLRAIRISERLKGVCSSVCQELRILYATSVLHLSRMPILQLSSPMSLRRIAFFGQKRFLFLVDVQMKCNFPMFMWFWEGVLLMP